MQEMNIKLPTKDQMTDVNGRPLTQSMFLEIVYNDFAIYTLKDDHWELNGKFYPSLKRLYLEMEDPTEYEFASTYLLGFRHWKRLCENKVLLRHITEWREELEYKLRSKAVKHMLNSAKEGNYQAAKWFADRGWANNGAGRPSKADIESEKQFQARVSQEYKDDVVRLFDVKSA
jgi:hypothetical protein